MFSFITRRSLFLNILAAVVAGLVLLLLFVLSLNWITHHGKASVVPLVAGRSLDEASRLLEKQGFDVVIQDSIYIDTIPRLAVIRQVPDADAVVKVNRTVYLTINRAVPPVVEMPNLVGYSFRNADMVLKNMGLRIGDTVYRPDFAKNAVLEQRYHDARIAPGTKIQQGSPITLVLGTGIGNTEFVVPNLVGLPFGQARTLLESNGLSMGSVIPDPDVTDTLTAYIKAQRPTRLDAGNRLQHIRPGQMMDVWLSVQKPVLSDTLAPAVIPQQQ